MRLAKSAVALLLTFASARTQLGQVNAQGNITVLVVDGSGRTVDCRMHSFQRSDGKDISAQFAGLRGTNIPFGIYTYRVSCVSDGVPDPELVGRIEVHYRDDLFVIVQDKEVVFASVIAGEARPFPRGGKLVGLPELSQGEKQARRWIRFSPLWTDYPAVDAEVNSSGEFMIYRSLFGYYLATVIENGQILYTQEIVFGAPKRNSPAFVIDVRVAQAKLIEAN